MALGSNGRPYPPRATLAEIQIANATQVLFYCVARRPVSPVDCNHRGEMDLVDAIDRWGGNVRLNDLPVKCGKCGGRYVDIRPHYPYSRGSHGARARGA
jgi:hypothetical protein